MLPAHIQQSLYYDDKPVTDSNAMVELARVSGVLTDPLHNLNTAGSNLLLRLLQIDSLGSHIRDAIILLTADHRELYVAERKIVMEVEELEKKNSEIAKEGWNVIIQNWELFVGAAKTRAEWSDLIYCDKTRSKWVLISLVPFTPQEMHKYKDDIEMVLKRQVLHFMALIKYLPLPEIEWIQATNTSLRTPSLQPELFSPIENTSLNSNASSTLPRIFKFTSEDVKPCLTPSELHKIDEFLKYVKKEPKTSVKSQIQLDENQPDPFPLNYRSLDCARYFSQSARQTCMNCEITKEASKLFVCTGCWSILYCSQACQRQHYSTHKRLCAKKEKKKEQGV